MQRHLSRIKPGQPIGMALVTFIPFPNSLIRANNRFVKNGTANFGRNIPTEISGSPPEVIPNIPVGRNRNGPFHLNCDRNFRNLWHNGSILYFHDKNCTLLAPVVRKPISASSRLNCPNRSSISNIRLAISSGFSQHGRTAVRRSAKCFTYVKGKIIGGIKGYFGLIKASILRTKYC